MIRLSIPLPEARHFGSTYCYRAVLADEVECPFFKASASNSIILLSLSHVDVFYDAYRHFTDIAIETDFSLCQLLPHIAGDRSHDKDNDDHQNRHQN